MILDGLELFGCDSDSSAVFREDVPDLPLHKFCNEQSLQEVNVGLQ